MNRLFVFYDDRCAFCCWCRDWVSAQTQYLPIEFRVRPAASVPSALPELAECAPAENLVVFSDTGLVYFGDQALIMILWGLRDWRGWSRWLSKEENVRLAGRLWNLIHENRGQLGWILHGAKTPDALSLDRFWDRLPPSVSDPTVFHAHIKCEIS